MAENLHDTKKEGCHRVEQKISKKENLDDLDETGLTELHKAVLNTNIPLIHLLLQAGASVNVKDPRSEWTPLMIASYQRDCEIIEILFNQGANVNEISEDRQSALHLAIGPDNDSVKAVKLLLKHGSNVDAKDYAGAYPAYQAILHSNTEILSLLVQHGANIKTCVSDMGECSNIFMSDVNQYSKCMDILLSAGADINSLCDRQFTPLMHSVLLGKKGSMIYLLKRNADIAATCNPHRGQPRTAFTMALGYLKHRSLRHGLKPVHYIPLKLCYVAGGIPPSIDCMKRFLPDFLEKSPVPELRQWCRKTIRSHLMQVNPPGNLFTYVPKLYFPAALKSYLLYGIALEDFNENNLEEHQRFQRLVGTNRVPGGHFANSSVSMGTFQWP